MVKATVLTVTINMAETDFVLSLLEVLKRTVDLITEPEAKQQALEDNREWEEKYTHPPGQQNRALS